jgi:hypothetical protein
MVIKAEWLNYTENFFFVLTLAFHIRIILHLVGDIRKEIVGRNPKEEVFKKEKDLT